MIHIVFSEADIKVLKEAIALDESMRGEVVQLKDDYAVGPLNNIYLSDGIDARKQWWQEVLAGGDYDGKADSRHRQNRHRRWASRQNYKASIAE